MLENIFARGSLLVAVVLALSACPSDPLDDGSKTVGSRMGKLSAAGPDAGASSDPSPQRFFNGEARAAASAEVARLEPIRAQFQAQMMATPGVFAFGIGLDRSSGRLVFDVVFDESKPAPSLPSTLGEVPLVVRPGKPPVATDGVNLPAPNSCTAPCHANQDFILPVQMGNSGATAPALGNCTMGFKACDASTGRSVWVTAAHCAQNASTCPGSAPIGTLAYHPSLGDVVGIPPSVGAVARHAPPVANGTTDATAIASAVSLTLPSVRDIGGISTTVASVLPGDAVQKSGRTTGFTTGLVVSVSTAVNVSYNCGTLLMTQQLQIVDFVTANFGARGDSGSGVFDFSIPPNLVGLYIAGVGATGFANEAGNVLTNLGLTMDFTACVDTACPAIFATSSLTSGARILSLLYRLRDDVLAESDRFRSWVGRFYQVAFAWFRLYQERPELLQATKNSLLANAPVLEAIVDGRPVTVARQQLNSILQLIGQHAQAATDPALRAAFQSWRGEVNDPKVQAELGVTVN